MKRSVMLGLAIALPMVLMGNSCEDAGNSNKYGEAEKAKAAANSIHFSDNAEIKNIKRRLELTGHPGQLGFVLLLNEMGQPVLYTSVRGKITSGTKRLTEPDRASSMWGGGNNTVVRSAPSDEGTWGSSSEFIFFWTENDEYIQWNGKYLYSDKPFRLKVEPLAVTVSEPKK